MDTWLDPSRAGAADPGVASEWDSHSTEGRLGEQPRSRQAYKVTQHRQERCKVTL
jgi:hypothetical protein